MELGEVCEINPKKSQVSKLPAKTEVSFVPMADVLENAMQFEAKQIKNLSDVSGSYTYFADNDVLLAKVTPCFENGKAGIARKLKNGIGFGSSEFIVLRASKRILPEIVYGIISSDEFRESGKSQMSGTGGLQRVPPDFVKKFKIPLPPLEIQKQLVAEAEKEEEILAANRRLIELMERKIEKKLSDI
ncbi:MAG: restriction endonuclease subunit S [bacterium]|nr:restriction endonuclease subunit S [bacterium]